MKYVGASLNHFFKEEEGHKTGYVTKGDDNKVRNRGYCDAGSNHRWTNDIHFAKRLETRSAAYFAAQESGATTPQSQEALFPWYFSFGYGQHDKNPRGGIRHLVHHFVVIVTETENKAREMMGKVRGLSFCTTYKSEYDIGVERHGLTKIPFGELGGAWDPEKTTRRTNQGSKS